MDALIIAGFVLAVTALAFWVFTTFAIAYVIWKYVYTPWRVVRADIAALNQEIANLRQQARVKVMTDEEQARVEARLNARQRVRMGMPS